MKILIVEDDRLSRTELTAILRKMGHEVIPAHNGSEALELFTRENPELIFMDVLMPVMDGHACAERIKEQCGQKFVPIVFLTSMTDEEELARCVQSGGDDFLSKPYNHILIGAKIAAMQRIRALHERVVIQAQALQRHNAQLEHEMRIASHVFNTVMARQSSAVSYLQSWIQPVAAVSGDLILHARCPSGQLHVLLGDFTGHGLSAAIGAVPVSDIFYAMTAKGFGIGHIVTEMNRKLHHFLPVGHFCAATLVSIDPLHDKIEIWNGGMPPVLALDSEGAVIKRIAPGHLALGVASAQKFSAQTKTLALSEVHTLLLYSDGLTESRNVADGRFDLDTNLERARRSSSGDIPVFDAVKNGFEGFMDKQAALDDVSLLAVRCHEYLAGFGTRERGTTDHYGPQAQVSEWAIEIKLDALALKKTDPQGALLQWMVQTQLPEGPRTQVYTVLTELVNNAVEHGLLRMDSSWKNHCEGFEKYYEERSARLRDLASGYLRVRLEQWPVAGGRAIKICVEDSGPGFNVQGVVPALGSGERLYGRGIALARKLTTRLEYDGCGNKVEAEYHG